MLPHMSTKGEDGSCMSMQSGAYRDQTIILRCESSLLQLQWKQDLDLGLELISKAIEIDNKCDFAYETMGTIEVQR